MKRLFALLLPALLLTAACGELDIATPDEDGKTNNGGGTAGVEDSEVLAVWQVANCPIDTIINVKGYIVGYVDGSSLATGAVFGVPELRPNTNMLLADSPDERGTSACIAVRLEDSENYGYRSQLNLYDNPDLYQQPIIILGIVGTYFRKTGITRVLAYGWEEEEETPDGGIYDLLAPGIIEEEAILEGR